MNLVNAQQTRRMLDRMVGYRISPLLWAKVKRGLSAGRVQSVALRMICDREDEINAFIPEEYWNLDALLMQKGSKRPLEAKYYGPRDSKGGRTVIHSQEELDAVLKDLEGCRYEVEEIKKGERIKKAPIPFTTSTLQQEASKALNFSTQKTMRLAQQLYEGVEVKGHGTIGLITYLRTDSTRIAEEADLAAREFVREHYGDSYVAEGESQKKNGQKIQDAHEAIRPTDIRLTPVIVKESLSRDLFRLYQLIWKRFAASRMRPAVYETTNVRIGAGSHIFTASASRLSFDGFMSVYVEADDEAEKNSAIGRMGEGNSPDSRGTRDLVSLYPAAGPLYGGLSGEGSGRAGHRTPQHLCTYDHNHHSQAVCGKGEQKSLCDGAWRDCEPDYENLLPKHCGPELYCEYGDHSLLDRVADGSVDWKTIVRNFYPDLDEAVKEAEKQLETVKIEDEVTDEICEQCGRHMVIKYGPHGKFLACPGFPECKNTKPYLEKIGVPCPKCGGEVVRKKTKKGRLYFGCENNPECDFLSWQKPSTAKCPKCGSYMVEKGNKLLCANETCGYRMDKA